MAEETTTQPQSPEVPEDLAALAQRRNWPLVVVQQALARGLPPAQLKEIIASGMTPQQAMQAMAARALMMGQTDVQIPPPSFSWMGVPTEWGIHARPSKAGLRFRDINIGSYGYVPDHWPFDTEIARGSWPAEGVEGMGYSIFEKQEVWADNAVDLYEEAIQRRWRPSTDIPWETLQPLPDAIEAAMCQLCTQLSQWAYQESVILSKWLKEISYGYIEIKSFLSTQIFEDARHTEAFRKRALSNGGALGLEPPNIFMRTAFEARNYTEMSLMVHILHGSFVEVLYQYGHLLAHNEAERRLFSLALQDKARHVAYGVDHLRFVLGRRPDRREELNVYLGKAEVAMTKDLRDPSLSEPLALLLAGSPDRIKEGWEKLAVLRKRQVGNYLRHLEAAGLPERADRIKGLRRFLDQ